MKIKTSNKLLFSQMFPNLWEIGLGTTHYTIIYGSYGMGKTELCNYLYHVAKEKYGREAVDAYIGDLDPVMEELDEAYSGRTGMGALLGGPKVLLLFFDGVRRVSLENERKLLELRRKLGTRLLNIYFAVEEDSPLPSLVMDLCSFLILLSTPVTVKSWLKKFPKEAVEQLKRLTALKKKDDRYKAYKLFWSPKGWGWLKTGLVADSPKKVEEPLFPFFSRRRRRSWLDVEEDEGMEWYYDEE